MKRAVISAIVRKDLQETMQKKAAVLPLVIVPLIFLVLAPIGVAFGSRMIGGHDWMNQAPMSTLLKNAPASVAADLRQLPQAQQFVVLMSCYGMAPLFLIIPLMVASIFAANSFAGELERKTMEAMLYTPATDFELFFGKFLAAFLPGMAVAWAGFVLYAVTVNAANYPTIGRLFFPTWSWLVLMVWLAPAIAGLGALVLVLISSRVGTFMEAQQLGAATVVPFLGLFALQFSGLLYFGAAAVFLLGVAFWLLDGLLLHFSLKFFQRQSLMLKL